MGIGCQPAYTPWLPDPVPPTITPHELPNAFNKYHPDHFLCKCKDPFIVLYVEPPMDPSFTFTVQCTKLCRSELPANDVMRSVSAPRPFLLLPRVLILRHCDAFVTNIVAHNLRKSHVHQRVGSIKTTDRWPSDDHPMTSDDEYTTYSYTLAACHCTSQTNV
ncbi:hypothetical protein EVAR_61869_1 [Eumeta japonica]|uniref:Uncharacterized protein n=1 Tax=Eumeta variegata TaxID=151549 RepID=A0A4C1ZLS8_EUMVA|nr:hypothetical protein EVAR_61869_1 [Eumeta japonica]